MLVLCCVAKKKGFYLPENCPCMGAVDEDMSESRKALEGKVEQDESSTNLRRPTIQILFLF